MLVSVVPDVGSEDKEHSDSTDFVTVIVRAQNDLSTTSTTLQEADSSKMLDQAF